MYKCILTDVSLKVEIASNNNKFDKFFLKISLIIQCLKSQNDQIHFKNLTADDLESGYIS